METIKNRNAGIITSEEFGPSITTSPNKEDNRKIALKSGLRQLTTEKLLKVLYYKGKMCLDTYNYNSVEDTYCPLSIAEGLNEKYANNPKVTNELVYTNLVKLGYKVYNTKGIKGEFYTNNRYEDLIIALKEVLQERLNEVVRI